jgi:hypothetical protein
MNESKALLGLPSEFTLAGVKVRVYQPNVEWVLRILGQMGSLAEAIDGKDIKGLVPVLDMVMSTIRLPWHCFAFTGWQKLLWFRSLNATQQAYFLEKWLEAVDINGIKDCFLRAGKAVSNQLGIRDTP